ncbi:MAG: LPS assembly lipoprotein LptE [Proteobacteria bacterium]|nr:LPS assembly lipoprotein LptE [Pseudomonadota bacterium]
MVKEKGIFGGEISSIYIPLFKNKTYEPHASGYVTDAFAKELVATGLFKLNKEGSDGYIQGSINKIRIIPSAMNAQGIVVEKSVDMTVDLSLFNKTGAFIKKWTLSETEIYSVNDVSSEDYNKREALRRMSGRMARKFSSIALIDY